MSILHHPSSPSPKSPLTISHKPTSLKHLPNSSQNLPQSSLFLSIHLGFRKLDPFRMEEILSWNEN
jgi:hypothetical protein